MVDLFVGFMVIEAVALLAWLRRFRRGVAPGPLVASLLAGCLLPLALRGALTGASWPVTTGWLAAAPVAYIT